MIDFPAKKLRAQVIADYVKQAGFDGVVVFGCGNGADALRNTGIYVVDVSARGDIEAVRWWTPAEIARCWPRLFDATSGHLPAHLMVEIAKKFRLYLGALPVGVHEVPTGSGETILCLRWAYPEVEFVPVYNVGLGTEYNANAPLNFVVATKPE